MISIVLCRTTNLTWPAMMYLLRSEVRTAAGVEITIICKLSCSVRQ
jgi:hypothetical protein